MNNNGVQQQLKFLSSVLIKEVKLLGRIHEVELDKSRKLSKEKKIVDLTPENRRLQELIVEENKLEITRESILKELGLFFNKEPLTLQDLIEIGPEESREEFKIIFDSLKNLTEEIQFLTESNKVMINDILKLVDYTLDLIAQERTLEIDYGNKDAHKNSRKSIVINTVI